MLVLFHARKTTTWAVSSQQVTIVADLSQLKVMEGRLTKARCSFLRLYQLVLE